MRTSRRDFLKIGSLASASLLVPKIVSASNMFTPRVNGKNIVIIQLTGGNDGLNTVIPYRNDLYYKYRPKLGIERSNALSLTDEMGLHPSLAKTHDLFHNGGLSILNSVGYPNPNRSHFRSMDIWHSASDANEYLSTGWLGRLMDQQSEPMPYHAIEMNDKLSMALKGSDVKGLAIKNPADLYAQTKQPFIKSIYQNGHDHEHQEAAFLHRTLHETTTSIDYVYEKSKAYRSAITYPGTSLGKGLKTIAELIISGCNTMVYYVSHDGFDTHVGQSSKQKRLLGQYDDAVSAFVNDLKKNNRFDDTLIMTFSEFGRRVKQNASGGTDHGAASNVMLMSGALKQPGIFNESPNLQDLENGDIKYEIDFREVYATILDSWLGQSSKQILGQPFSALPLV